MFDLHGAHVTMTRAEWDAIVKGSVELADKAKECAEERDALRRDLDLIKTLAKKSLADAMRYQWMKEVHENGDESVTAWIGYFRADQWDEEIDKHRASECPVPGERSGHIE